MGYDYSQSGYYFITICAHNRKNLFGEIVGAIHESPEMKLNNNGLIIEAVINQLSKRYDTIDVDKYVIMPNHIHFIIIINNERAIHESPLQQRKRSILSQVVGYLKMNTTKQIHLLYPKMEVWQRSYHDHIIRNDEKYRQIWEYIDTNPLILIPIREIKIIYSP